MTTATTAKPKIRVHIRWMIRRDFPEVLAIEAANFDRPWTEDDFLAQLRDRKTIGMVAELGEAIVGFMVYKLHKTHLEILNFAVADAHHHRAVGAQMVAKLVGKLSSHRRTQIELAIPERNLDACLFFRSQGFLATQTIREAFADTGEDAIVMEYGITLPDPPT
jgi:ribosomal-protein-alanine N-acetyltransferase